MNQQTPLTRRAALRAFSAAALAAPLAQAAPARRLKPGQTSINWGFRVESAEPGVRDSAKLGYWGYESYGDVLEAVEEKIGWQRLLDQYNIPMPSSYFNFNLTDPTVRKDQVAKAIRMGNILKKCGGKTVVIGPNPVKRPPFDFNASKADIAATLNEVSKALEGIGLVAALHQHTGMCIDTRDEVYAIFDAVDTRVVKFGPDVGQLQKAGTDPVKVIAATSLCSSIAWPTTEPRPMTRLNTPGGMPAPMMICDSACAVAGTSSAGLKTTQLP